MLLFLVVSLSACDSLAGFRKNETGTYVGSTKIEVPSADEPPALQVAKAKATNQVHGEVEDIKTRHTASENAREYMGDHEITSLKGLAAYSTVTRKVRKDLKK